MLEKLSKVGSDPVDSHIDFFNFFSFVIMSPLSSKACRNCLGSVSGRKHFGWLVTKTQDRRKWKKFMAAFLRVNGK